MSGHAGSFTNADFLYASFKINFLVAVSCSERQTDPNFLLEILNLSFCFSILLLNLMRNVDPADSACYSQGSQMKYFEPCMRHTLENLAVHLPSPPQPPLAQDPRPQPIIIIIWGIVCLLLPVRFLWVSDSLFLTLWFRRGA